MLFVALLAGAGLMGCASHQDTYQGGTGDYHATYSGQGTSGVPTQGNDFGRGSDRFNQESSQMLPATRSDTEIYRQ
jgi:hypothetical protein